MTKVTYLLGAGASYGAVPIVGEMEQRVFNIYNALCNDKYEEVEQVNPGQKGYDKWRAHRNIVKLKEDKDNLKSSELETLEKFSDDLKWLHNGMENHASVDTFGKKLYLKRETSLLTKLKYLLSAYLTIEQFISSPDPRYDKFFATILEDSASVFPNGMKVISWNYDFQFELAYNEYRVDSDLWQHASNLGVVTKGTLLALVDHQFIFKLNGSAGVISKDYIAKYMAGLAKGENRNNILRQILEIFEGKNSHNEISSALSFAWEREKGLNSKPVLDIAIEQIKNSTHIVVIGYSFPYFNARVDKQLMQTVKDKNVKFYVQDPNANKVVESLREITGFGEELNVESIDYTTEFFIPYDFFG